MRRGGLRGLLRGAMLALALGLTAEVGGAVTPGEVLEDPALEARARDLSAQLRCMVCRNEAIDESNADLARDMRLLVRERLLAGDTDAEVLDFVVDRYGEYALLRPNAEGANLILWIAGPAMLLVALGVGGGYVWSRRRRPGEAEAPLTDEERARLADLLDDAK
jgi:cytochrome c-type biogenesis protein CcmH